ncbi:MAG: DUF1684 domain-containing protein [Lutibacter sp.]|nr:DUF1684 domain-containing protein [Lutibacter sp.]
MKYTSILLLLAIYITSCNSKNNNYTQEIQQFQYKMNTEFADANKSPLTEKDIKTFKSLDFFPINENYKVEATLKLTPNEPVFEMKTTSDRLPLYKKYGELSFKINEKLCLLSVFQNQEQLNSFEYNNLLFLPFSDLTNNKTTYAGGRYLDLETPTKGKTTIILDFNKAYNPYCAYNHDFSYPVPPAENNLQVAIEAGVKKYKLH